MSEMRFSAQEFAALLSWKMVSDPWPADSATNRRITQMLNEEARARNYEDWVEAYHELNG